VGGVLRASFLPEEVSDQTGQLVTLAFSLLTVGILPLVWRGVWEPGSERFSVQMFTTVIVMMMANYHNHIHRAALGIIVRADLASLFHWGEPRLAKGALRSEESAPGTSDQLAPA
jgi:hypothetical protein